MIIDGNKLTPSDGFAAISNGTVISELVFLGDCDSADHWYDTNGVPPPEPEPEETATTEDYENALEVFGV